MGLCRVSSCFFVTLQAYLIGIGASIWSGRESWCLPYAGFLGIICMCHLWGVICQVSYVRCHLYFVICQVSFVSSYFLGFICQVSFVRWHLSDVICQISFVRCNLSGVIYRCSLLGVILFCNLSGVIFRCHLSGDIFQVAFVIVSFIRCHCHVSCHLSELIC